MIKLGDHVELESGRRVRVTELLGKPGGQGIVYLASARSGEQGALKIFHADQCSQATIARTRFLIDQDWGRKCGAICAPIDLFVDGGLVGHWSPFQKGQPLEEFLEPGGPRLTFLEHLQVGYAVARGVSVLHAGHQSHGDLQANNVIVHKERGFHRVSLIDLDNFCAPGQPPPPCIGQLLYIAPELRAAMSKKRPAVPSIATDRFALAVLMHEMLLLRHVAHGRDGDPDDFYKAMVAHRWLQDPAAVKAGNIPGYPAEVLNTNLVRLFRMAFSGDPAARPTAKDWEDHLLLALHEIDECQHCGGQFVSDDAKSACPYPQCGRVFPALKFNASGGEKIAIVFDRGATVIGRDRLKSQKVSARHAVVRRSGPDFWLEDLGSSNGTYRKSGAQWARFPKNTPRLIQVSDVIRFADVEGKLELSS